MSTTYADLTQDIYRISKECAGEGNLSPDIINAKETFVSIVSMLLANNLIIQEYGEIESYKKYQLYHDMNINIETLYQLRTSIKVIFQEGVIDSILSNIIDEDEYFIYILLLNKYKKFGNQGVKKAIITHDIENIYKKESFISDIVEKINCGWDFMESVKNILKDRNIDIDDEKNYLRNNDILLKMIFQFNKYISQIIQNNGVFIIENVSHTLN